MKGVIIIVLTTALAVGMEAGGASASETEDGGKKALSAYLRKEAARIMMEGDQIKSEADRMRSEAARLSKEANELRNQASHLDALWDSATRANPAKYVDYEGRDRSQRRLRADADREDRDEVQLREEGSRLDDEAIRLWRLSVSVNPEAHMDFLIRMQRCCSRKSGIDQLRSKIVEMARALNLKYIPH